METATSDDSCVRPVREEAAHIYLNIILCGNHVFSAWHVAAGALWWGEDIQTGDWTSWTESNISVT